MTHTRWFRFLAGLTVLVAAAAIVVALRDCGGAPAGAACIGSPGDVGTGQRVRILYVHAGAAWTAYLAYAVTAAAAVGTLWRRTPRWDRLAIAAAEWGLVLTTVTLVTGSLWGRAVNNWWWRWSDPRLTITLLLWFLYAGLVALRQATPRHTGATLAAVLALVGVPLMVLNHFAVTWWNVAHPPQIVLRPGGPAVDDPMLYALGLAFAAYTLVFVTVLILRIDLEVERDRLAGALW